MRRLFSAMRARRSASYSAMAAVERGRGVCWLAAATDSSCEESTGLVVKMRSTSTFTRTACLLSLQAAKCTKLSFSCMVCIF